MLVWLFSAVNSVCYHVKYARGSMSELVLEVELYLGAQL